MKANITPKVDPLTKDVERMLEGLIADDDIRHEKVKEIKGYINKTVREFMRSDIAVALSAIYNNDNMQLEADLARLAIFNPDAGNSIYNNKRNRVGALNSLLPIIGIYFNSYDDLIDIVKHPYKELTRNK